MELDESFEYRKSNALSTSSYVFETKKRLKVKVKQSNYRLGQALRVPEV
jgi:hypothetical protein